MKRPDGNEITEGERESTNPQQKQQANLSEASSMETSQLLERKMHEEECQYCEDGPNPSLSEALDTGVGICLVRAQDKGTSGTDDVEDATELEVSEMQRMEDVVKQEKSDPQESDQDSILPCQTVKEKTKEVDYLEQRLSMEEETTSPMTCDANEVAFQNQSLPMVEEPKITIAYDAKTTTLQQEQQPEETYRILSCDAKGEQIQQMEVEIKLTVAGDANETDLHTQNQPIEEETKSSLYQNAKEKDLTKQGQLMEKEINIMLSCNVNDIDVQDQSKVEEANQEQVQSSIDSCHLVNVDIRSSLAVDASERNDQAEKQNVKEEPNKALSFQDKESDYQTKKNADQAQNQLTKEDKSSTHSTDSKENDLQVQGYAMEEDYETSMLSLKCISHHTNYETCRKWSSNVKEEDHQVQDQLEVSEHQESQEPLKKETILERQIKELAISDASTESCHDDDLRDDLSDCLHVEMAIITSDSDNEEHWKSTFSQVIDEDDMESDINKERINQEQETGGDLTSLSGCKSEDLEILEQPECSTECDLDDSLYDSIHYSSLSKIPEDEETTLKHSLQRLSASTSELDKKLPQDFCVVQDMKSENVSTEHLDFKVARQQWQKMEKQTKERILQPTVKQDFCQGGQNLMYTPIRNLERSRRDPDTENLSLSLGEFPYTQFSPSSDDSGLDDASYRSHYDEPETPVEREIRETLEREETFRRERAISTLDTDETATDKVRPLSLLPSGTDLDKKLYNTREDRCRLQRCQDRPSAKSPILSSPKTPYQEMVAKNVIILEPDSHPTNSRHNNKSNFLSPANRFHEWPTSGTSNVIVLETSNLIIRSVSEFCLNTAGQETQESTFQNNPFFKLRSHSTQSLVEREIREVRQRDEEFRKQRALLYTREKYDTVLVSPSSPLSFTYDRPGTCFKEFQITPGFDQKHRKLTFYLVRVLISHRLIHQINQTMLFIIIFHY